jgi:hypothetical protein
MSTRFEAAERRQTIAWLARARKSGWTLAPPAIRSPGRGASARQRACARPQECRPRVGALTGICLHTSGTRGLRPWLSSCAPVRGLFACPACQQNLDIHATAPGAYAPRLLSCAPVRGLLQPALVNKTGINARPGQGQLFTAPLSASCVLHRQGLTQRQIASELASIPRPLRGISGRQPRRQNQPLRPRVAPRDEDGLPGEPLHLIDRGPRCLGP